MCSLVALSWALLRCADISNPDFIQSRLLVAGILLFSFAAFIVSLKYKIKLEKFFSASFRMIFFMISFLAIMLSLWTFNGRIFVDLIYLLTLVVIIIYSYYTLKIVKYAYLGPALLFVQQEHTKVLKDFLSEWADKIEVKPYNYFSGTDYDTTYKMLENQWQFTDLLKNHLPVIYNGLDGIEGRWAKFKEMNLNYQNKKRALYILIEEKISNYFLVLRDSHVNIKIAEAKYIEHFIHNVYACAFYGNPEGPKKELNLEMISRGKDNKFALRSYNDILIDNGTEEEITSFKLELDAIIMDIANKNRDNINNVVQDYNDLIVLRGMLMENISELRDRPLFPGANCDRLRDFSLEQ